MGFERTVFGRVGVFSQWTPGASAPKRRAYGQVLARPMNVAPGMQSLSMSVPSTWMTCDLFGCEWYLYGKEGEEAGKPFRHPQGVMCGDFDRCPDKNCPCPQRVLQWPEKDDKGRQRRYGHFAADHEVTPRLRVTDRTHGQRVVDPSEFIDRQAEGIETLTRMLTRGL